MSQSFARYMAVRPGQRNARGRIWPACGPPISRTSSVPSGSAGPGLTIDDLERASVEVRPVTRQQVFVNGKPVGEDFE